MSAKQIYQIKVTLDYTKPPIWRRIQVAADITLKKLHEVLQIVMGWTDSHLHEFSINGEGYGIPDVEFPDVLDEARYKLNGLVGGEGQIFGYEYDFGDGWEHTLTIEKILPAQGGAAYPRCLAGELACPPEDSGGVGGYEYFLEAIGDPTHQDHDEYLEWYGGGFDPDRFDLKAVNAALSRWKKGGRRREPDEYWPEVEETYARKRIDLPTSWHRSLSEEDQEAAERLALRRDVLAMLAYLQENKVTGTASTGNFPLKAVSGISTRFVDPPPLESRIGEQVYPVRSETEVWPLYLRHVLAAVGGLIAGGRGRRWRISDFGERFLSALPAHQVWILSVTWWTQVNWRIAVPFGSEDSFMPRVSGAALRLLLDLPVGREQPYLAFADRLIAAAGLFWPIEDQESAIDILHMVVEMMVINPVVDLGILQPQYQEHRRLGSGYRELAAIQMTPFGRGLLEALEKAISKNQ